MILRMCLIKDSRQLDIKLASDEEGEKLQISTIKAEEWLRAKTAEAAYRAQLGNLKQEECVQEDLLSLNIIENSQREGVTPPPLILKERMTRKVGVRGGARKRRNEVSILEYQRLWEA
jgi:hypothetical protein